MADPTGFDFHSNIPVLKIHSRTLCVFTITTRGLDSRQLPKGRKYQLQRTKAYSPFQIVFLLLVQFFQYRHITFRLSMLHSRTCTDKSCALSRNDGSSIRLQNVKHFIRHDTPRPAILLVFFQDLSVKLVLPLINTSCKTKVFCLESHPMSQKIKQAKWLHYYLGAPSHFSRHSLLNDRTTLSSCSRLQACVQLVLSRLFSSRKIEMSCICCIDVCSRGGYR